MRRHASEGWACAGFYLRYAYPAYDETLHLDLGIASLRHDKWCNRGMDQEIAFRLIDEHTMSFVAPVNRRRVIQLGTILSGSGRDLKATCR